MACPRLFSREAFDGSGGSPGNGFGQALDGLAGAGLIWMQLWLGAISVERGRGLPALLESGTQGVMITIGVRAEGESFLKKRDRFGRALFSHANLAQGKPGVRE